MTTQHITLNFNEDFLRFWISYEIQMIPNCIPRLLINSNQDSTFPRIFFNIITFKSIKRHSRPSLHIFQTDKRASETPSNRKTNQPAFELKQNISYINISTHDDQQWLKKERLPNKQLVYITDAASLFEANLLH